MFEVLTVFDAYLALVTVVFGGFISADTFPVCATPPTVPVPKRNVHPSEPVSQPVLIGVRRSDLY